MSAAFWIESAAMIAMAIAGGFFGYSIGHERGQSERRRSR